MMKTAAERIRARAKKEANIKDPDLGFGWRIDIQPTTKVERIGGDDDDDDDMEKKKKTAQKVPAKRQRSGTKKAYSSRHQNPVVTDTLGTFLVEEKSQAFGATVRC